MLENDRAAVLAFERHLLSTEGPYHVGGAYYANEFDAERRRRVEAERFVRESRRSEALGRTCVATHPRIGTWLTARERSRVDLVAGDQFDLTHRDALHAIRADLTAGRIEATLVSAALLRIADLPLLFGIVRDFPGNPVVGVVADVQEPQALASALAFGQAGLQTLVDARGATGWTALRATLSAQRVHDAFIQRAIRELIGAENSELRATVGWSRFLVAAFSPRTASSKQVAATLGVGSSTLTSRFFRAGLPSPKRYVAHARLVWAARLGETPGLSITAIADRLDASSPQSFGRMVRGMMGVTAAEFRSRFDGPAMLERFRTKLVEPYRIRLQSFDPLNPEATGKRPAKHTRSARRFNQGGRAA